MIAAKACDEICKEFRRLDILKSRWIERGAPRYGKVTEFDDEVYKTLHELDNLRSECEQVCSPMMTPGVAPWKRNTAT